MQALLLGQPQELYSVRHVRDEQQQRPASVAPHGSVCSAWNSRKGTGPPENWGQLAELSFWAIHPARFRRRQSPVPGDVGLLTLSWTHLRDRVVVRINVNEWRIT
uniref:Uncharacterized protein n=1 Tax=Sphaerodactylus townsendi TaxID=933632 RepID=A0ACB8FD49_9SAUR